MAIHLVANLHFDGISARQAQAHGFADCRDMARRICETWRTRVAPEDTVWILGNVGNPVHLAGLPGRKHLVRGHLDPPAWNCLSTRRYESVCEGRFIETPGGVFYLSSEFESAPEETRVIYGRSRRSSPEGHLCVSAERIGWGPVSLEAILQSSAEVRQAA